MNWKSGWQNVSRPNNSLQNAATSAVTNSSAKTGPDSHWSVVLGGKEGGEEPRDETGEVRGAGAGEMSDLLTGVSWFTFARSLFQVAQGLSTKIPASAPRRILALPAF